MRERLLQKLLVSQEWKIALEVLQAVVKEFEDDALNSDDPTKESMRLHHAQAARLVARRFTTVLTENAEANG